MLRLRCPPANFFLDNASMEAVCTKITGATKRLRHILLHIHFILQWTQAGLIKLVLTPSNRMIVDVMTKPTPPATQWTHMPQLLGESKAMQIKYTQAWRIILKQEPQPTAQLQEVEQSDEDALADEAIKRSRSAATGSVSVHATSADERELCSESRLKRSNPSVTVHSAKRPLQQSEAPVVSAVSTVSSSTMESVFAAGIGAAVSAALSTPRPEASASELKSSNKKSRRICHYFQMGNCKHGEKCKNQHVDR